MNMFRELHKWYLEKRIIALFRKNQELRNRLMYRYGSSVE